MALTSLRAAQTMRSFFMNGSRAFTSRLMTTTSARFVMSQSSMDPHQTAQQPSQRASMPLEASTIHVADLSETSSLGQGKSSSTTTTTRALDNLDRVFNWFEERCHRLERVLERDFVRTFNRYAEAVDCLKEPRPANNSHVMSNIIIYSTLLLRCCGNLMLDTPPKGRELLAGNLWTFIKEKRIPLDVTHYNSLVRVLNENGTTYDPKKILDEMKEQNLTPDRITYQRLIHQYCNQGDIVGATNLLEVMKENDMELNETTFASLILGYSKQEKPPTISEMFDLMRSNNIEPNSKSYAAAFVAQAARLASKPDESVAEITRIFEMLQKDEIQFTINEISDLITALGPHRKSHDVVNQLFDLILPRLEGSVTSRYRIIASLIKANLLEDASELFWSQMISNKALNSGALGSYYIRALAVHHNVPAEFALKECVKLEEKGWNLKAIDLLYFNAADSGRLEKVRAALKRITEQDRMKVHYVWPLIAQAKSNDEIVEVLKNQLNPRMNQTELLETFSMWVWPKFASDVSSLFELNKELGYDPNLVIASFLNYSVQENKVVEAIKFISEAPESLVGDVNQADADTNADEDGDMDSSTGQRGGTKVTARGDLVANLLHQIVDETKDAELVKKAFNMCKLPNQRISQRSLGALVRVHLLNDNFNLALDEFLRIAKEYQMTPCRSELMRLCLVNKDPETLQKIMDAVTEIYGEANSLFDLALCCLKSDKLKQAQKIFSSQGFRVRPLRVYQNCRALARSGDLGLLENLVNLTRDMYDINQDYLYMLLIEAYERHDPKRTLRLWNMMQEEEFQPSKKCLFMIANVLEKNNIEVPFQKPRMSFQNDRDMKSAMNPTRSPRY